MEDSPIQSASVELADEPGIGTRQGQDPLERRAEAEVRDLTRDAAEHSPSTLGLSVSSVLPFHNERNA